MGFAVHVIDDDPSVRESLKALLGDAGYDVRCYACAETFLEQSGGSEGCALIDLRLESMDGLTLQQRLIAEQSNVDVIMMSAYGQIGDAVTAMRRGAIDFIEKPFAPDQMLARIRSLYKIQDKEELAQREARHCAALVELLTPRERQVLSMIVDGFANKQVANALGISARTVETHRVHIMQKLSAESLPHLVRIWISAGHHLEMPAF
ncbi:response regulator transcription factor [Salinisphaera aquimarina]|uniref:Response regulator transcription factor n=1 Tax=Salinisphaera aquimarina TaxID=2094031 RepID=A0ABV7ETK2_9GAMM